MPTYWYTTAQEPDADRKVIHASSLPAALLDLKNRGEAVASAGLGERLSHPREKPVAEIDLLTAYRQLGSMLRGGTSLVDALSHLASDSPNPRLARALRGAAAAVAEGAPLWEAMEAFPRIFRAEVVAVVRAAEVSGDLDDAFESLADQGDVYYSLTRRASIPMIYPLLVACVAASLLSFFCTFLAPKMMMLYRELGMSDDMFPLPTLLIMWVSRWLPGVLGILSLIAIALVVLYFVYRRTASGRAEIDYWWLRVPGFGQLALSAAVARLCTTLGMLIRHRVPTAHALRLAGNASGSESLAAALRRAELVTEQGGTLAEGLKEAKALPPSLLWRLSAGEKSGTLPETCKGIARLYLETTELVSRRILAIVEPVAVIILGMVVAGAVLGMFLPLITIISELSQ